MEGTLASGLSGDAAVVQAAQALQGLQRDSAWKPGRDRDEDGGKDTSKGKGGKGKYAKKK